MTWLWLHQHIQMLLKFWWLSCIGYCSLFYFLLIYQLWKITSFRWNLFILLMSMYNHIKEDKLSYCNTEISITLNVAYNNLRNNVQNLWKKYFKVYRLVCRNSMNMDPFRSTFSHNLTDYLILLFQKSSCVTFFTLFSP